MAKHRHHQLLWEYFKRLFLTWQRLGPHLAALLAFGLGLWNGTGLPRIAWWGIALLAFITATYFVFAEAIKEREQTIEASADENKKLRAAIAAYEASHPQVTVGFPTHEGPSSQGFLRIPHLPMPDIDLLVEVIRNSLMKTFRKELEKRRSDSGGAPGMISRVTGPEAHITASYVPEAIIEYLEKARQYHKEHHRARLIRRSIGFLSFVIANHGSAVAESVRVEILLPPELATPTEAQWDAYRIAKHPPSFPEEPSVDEMFAPLEGGVARHLASLASSLAPRLPVSARGYIPTLDHLAEDIHGPSYEDGGNSAQYPTVDRLNPGDVLELPGEVPVWIGHLTEASTLEIRVAITAANLRQREIQHLTLHVRFDGEPTDTPEDNGAPEETAV